MGRLVFLLPLLLLLFISSAVAQPCHERRASEPFGSDPANEALRWFYESHYCRKDLERQRLLFYSTWFMNDPRVAMQTMVKENGTASTDRHVFNWAHQNYRVQQLSEEQMQAVRKEIEALPESAKLPPTVFLYIVSFKTKGEWATRVYDRRQLPAAVAHLHSLLGYEVDTNTQPKN